MEKKSNPSFSLQAIPLPCPPTILARFAVFSPHQVLQETKLLIENMMCRTILTSDHYTNYLDLAGSVPEDKERLLDEIDHALSWDESRFRPHFIARQ